MWIYSTRDLRGAWCRFLKPLSCVTFSLVLSPTSPIASLPWTSIAVSWTQPDCCALLNFSFLVLLSGKFLLEKSQGIVGVTLFPFLGTNCAASFSASENTCFICFVWFLVDYCGWISLILVIPFWPKVEIIYFRKFVCLGSTETDPQSSLYRLCVVHTHPALGQALICFLNIVPL